MIRVQLPHTVSTYGVVAFTMTQLLLKTKGTLYILQVQAMSGVFVPPRRILQGTKQSALNVLNIDNSCYRQVHYVHIQYIPGLVDLFC